MTLHRHHQTGPRRTGVRLALKDQLDLQRIYVVSVHLDESDRTFYVSLEGKIAADILQRHGVDVSLDKHTGRVTFNPEVVEA